MTTIRSVTAYLDEICPASMGLIKDQLGYLHGDGDAECKGVLCCWRAISPILDLAAREKLNAVIVHETLWTRHQKSGWYQDTPEDEKVANKRKREALNKGGLHLFRLHSNWDAYPKDGVPDQFGELLNLGPAVGRGKFTRVYELPQPETLDALVDRINQCPGSPAARVMGADPKKQVQRIGILIGGFGGNQGNMPEEVHRLGAEVIVVGDLCEIVALNAAELGMATIETLHSFTEEPAIRAQARLIAKRFPDLRVTYADSGIRAWEREGGPKLEEISL